MAPDAGPILVLGANGQVGFELMRSLAPLGRVVGLVRADADFLRPESLRDVIRRNRPRAVVIAAAYTAVDKAESEPDIARTVNAVSPGAISQEAGALGACVVHYSTDYVFDGTKDGLWMETDATGPLQAYGRTKLEGEQTVSRGNSRHLIFRTSWVFATRSTNFPRTMLRLAAAQDTLRVVTDQVGAPTSAALIADTTAIALGELLSAPAGDARWGLYHLATSGSTSWHGYAQRILDVARAAGLGLKATPESIAPITSAEFGAAARRPRNSRLDTSRLRSTFRVDLPDWTRDVDAVVRQLVAM